MNSPNPNLSPGFVHAQSVEQNSAPLKLVTFPDGFRCYTHTSIEETEFIYNEVIINREYLRHGLNLEGASSIFDIGANIGVFTLFARSVNPNAVIHAFEPIPETYEALARNVELHGLSNVHIHNCAVGSRTVARRTFAYYPNMAGNSTAKPAMKKPQLDFMEAQLGKPLTEFLFRSETRHAPMQTLSAVLDAENITAVDFLKIDVEGDELAVLKGIEDRHFAGIRNLVLESHTPRLTQKVRALLVRKGFTVFCDAGLSSLPDVSGVYAVKDS
jgi:FkbM family methyltransferase